MKADISKVNPIMADAALKNANNDKQAAYGRYIILHWHATGRFAPGFDNKDLQAYYDSLKSEV